MVVLECLLKGTQCFAVTGQAFHGLNLRVIAAGDSYNDTSMLGEADAGILFRPPENVIEEFPHFPVTREYDELRAAFDAAAKEVG